MFGGMRTVGDIKDVTDDRCFAMANMTVKKGGSASGRNGFTKQNTTSLGYAISGLFGFQGRKTGAPTVIATNGTDAETI